MEQKERVSTKVGIPVDIFNPLLKECFGKNLITGDYKDLVVYNLFPLYYQFVNMISLGSIVIAKSMLPEKEPPMLTSSESLLGYKAYLKTSEEEKKIEFSVPYDIFRKMLSVSYHGYEIMEFEEKGIRNEEVLDKITENACAYYYWCLFYINEGRRIGLVGYKEGKPNLEGVFTELDMQRFIPNYNHRKAFSLEDDDFLNNADEEEISERLVDMLSDFHKEFNNDRRRSALSKMLKQIEKYSSRMNWDYTDWLKKVTDEYS